MIAVYPITLHPQHDMTLHLCGQPGGGHPGWPRLILIAKQLRN